jgi:hypothetical protein
MILIVNVLKILLSEENGLGLDRNSLCFVTMDQELKAAILIWSDSLPADPLHSLFVVVKRDDTFTKRSISTFLYSFGKSLRYVYCIKQFNFSLLSLSKKIRLWGHLALCISVWLYSPNSRISESLNISLWSFVGTSYFLSPSQRRNS